ncbi:MAG: histidine phosphatase family protein [Rhodospirillales bacterium]|nr:histidine phosphatase family protein [Rhodospirillales bacterium]
MLPQRPFYLIRHGESEANAGGYYSGQMDVALTEKGRQQALAYTPFLTELIPSPDRIVHSHLARARDTAALMNQECALPMAESRDISEQHYGIYQGRIKSELKADHSFKSWQEPPEGETFETFAARVRKGMNDILAQPGLPLISCHGGIFLVLGHTFGFGTTWHTAENAILHYFEPAPTPETSDFPWKVSQIIVENGKLTIKNAAL